MANENEAADEPQAAGKVSSPSGDHAVEDNDDEAWEGFALDTVVFRDRVNRHDG